MPKNDTIFKRLEQATETERKEICNILGLNKNYINNIDEISAEFRSVSGHTIANRFRDKHSLEYKFILKDTYCGLHNNDISKVSEIELETKVESIMDKLYQNNKTENFRDILISKGQQSSITDIVLGGGGVGLFAKFITLPVAIGATVGQAISAPTYRKTFQVVAKLIQIKKRIKVEQQLKDL